MPEPPLAELERIREQVHSDAETLSTYEIWQRSARARTALIEQLLDVNDAQAAWRPPGDDDPNWTIAEVARHILTSGTVDVIEALLRGGHAEKEPPSAIDVAPAPIEKLRDQLVAQSQRLLSAELRASGPIDHTSTAEAFFFGHLTARGWTLLESLHDQEHAAQIETIKASPGYPD